MLIERMPDVLAWEEQGPETWFVVHEGYDSLLADRLGSFLARIGRSDPEGAAALRERVRRLSDPALKRFLHAPETACRLCWPMCHSPSESMAFLGAALHSEMRLDGDPVDPGMASWSALGDALVCDESIERQPSIAGFPPIDLLSPHALGVDLEGELLRLPSPRNPQPVEERHVILNRLAEAADGLAQLGEEWLLFVRTFTKVLVVQADHDAPLSFSSGTSGQYPGRSVLANAHLPNVTIEVIVDALIHESIHGLLYMQEQQRPWVHAEELYGGGRVTTSPWTGTKLPVRPYMQAAFVWYGLLHFWSNALEAGVFDAVRARERLRIAARGFLSEPLVRQLDPYKDQISPELPIAITEMQARVQRNLEAAAHA